MPGAVLRGQQPIHELRSYQVEERIVEATKAALVACCRRASLIEILRLSSLRRR